MNMICEDNKPLTKIPVLRFDTRCGQYHPGTYLPFSRQFQLEVQHKTCSCEPVDAVLVDFMYLDEEGGIFKLRSIKEGYRSLAGELYGKLVCHDLTAAFNSIVRHREKVAFDAVPIVFRRISSVAYRAELEEIMREALYSGDVS